MSARSITRPSNFLEEAMADRNSNLGGRSDESRNPDLDRSEGGMSGSGSGSSDRNRDQGSSRDSGTSRDRGTSRETGMGDDLSESGNSGRSGSSSTDSGSESESDLGNDEIGDENVSNR